MLWIESDSVFVNLLFSCSCVLSALIDVAVCCQKEHPPVEVRLRISLEDLTPLVVFLKALFSALYSLLCTRKYTYRIVSNRSFRYASPCLWNQLCLFLHQPHSGTSFSISYSPISFPITSSSFASSLRSSITPSLFHSRFKTYLFHRSYPRSFTSSSRIAFTDYCPDLFFWAARFLVFYYFFSFLCRAVVETGHLVSFCAHMNVLYRICFQYFSGASFLFVDRWWTTATIVISVERSTSTSRPTTACCGLVKAAWIFSTSGYVIWISGPTSRRSSNCLVSRSRCRSCSSCSLIVVTRSDRPCSTGCVWFKIKMRIKTGHLYSAYSWIHSPLKLSEWDVLRRDHTVLPPTSTRLFTNGMSHSAFDPQPQHITALWPILISRPTEVECWVGLDGWLHTEDGHPSQYQLTDSAAAGDQTHDQWVASPTPLTTATCVDDVKLQLLLLLLLLVLLVLLVFTSVFRVKLDFLFSFVLKENLWR